MRPGRPLRRSVRSPGTGRAAALLASLCQIRMALGFTAVLRQCSVVACDSLLEELA